MSDYISKSALSEMLMDIEWENGTLTAAILMLNDIPTVDEKEIIRKTVERIVERLGECEKDCRQYKYMTDFQAQANAYLKAQEIVKEEGGME